MRTFNLVLAVFLFLTLESYSSGLKWDTLETKFDKIYYHGDSFNETSEYLSGFGKGHINEFVFIEAYFWILKKDLSENSVHLIEEKDNPNKYRHYGGFLREDNLLIVVSDSGYIFQKQLNQEIWSISKKIENSLALSNIIFKDNEYGLLTSRSLFDQEKEQIYYTEDGGESWNLLVNNFDDFENRYIIKDLKLFGDTIIAVVYDYVKNSLFLKVSYNLGQEWDGKKPIPISFQNTIHYQLQNNRLWMAGSERDKQGTTIENDVIIYTEDFGESWVEQIYDNYGYILGVKSLVFLDDLSEGFAIDRNGVFQTKDGINWHFYDDLFYEKFQNLVLYNYQNELYLVRDNMVLKYDPNESSINETLASSITIYPNPASDFIEVNPPQSPFVKGGSELASRGISEIIITNMLGVVVSTSVNFVDTSASGGQVRIDVSHLPRGVYFLRIGTQVEKFVKK